MGAVDPDLILETPCCRVQAHSQVLSLYCPRMASALDQPDQLVRDPESGLPIVQWCWPQEVEIPGALHPGCITIPATDAVLALLYLCYQHHQYAAGTEAPLEIGHVQAILGQSWYCVAVLAVVAQDFGWSDLLRMLDGMLAQLPGPVLLGPGTIQFARQIHLRDTLRSAIRAGVVHDPVQLELQPVVTLGEISDALLSWSSPNVRFIDLVRCAAKLSLSPEQILRQVHEDQHFCITIESTDRLRYLLRWIRRINVWGFDFWNGWFSRCGYMIVERIKVQSSSKADQHDGVLMLKDLQSLLLDIVKNELICIPNPDRMFLGLDLSQCVFSPKLAVSAWRLPFA